MARKSRKTTETTVSQISYQPTFWVGAYVRLSDMDRKQKGDSIETQQAIIAAYVAEYPDLELKETYIDNGLTGQNFDRPAFQRMLADFESGKINCCVTKDLSRLGRNSIDSGYYIEKYFPTHGIRFIAINDNYDSADSRSGGIMVSLKNLVNEAYALDIGRKTKATIQMNIKNGCFVGRFPPYGYLKNREDNHKLVPDPHTAPVVRRVFEMAANGDSLRAISNWLSNNGVLPPKHYLFEIGLVTEKEVGDSSYWSKNAISLLLKNRIYVGDMVQGKGSSCQYIRKRLPQSEWVITENTHEAIVSRELFGKVQKLRKTSTPHGKTLDELRTANPLLRKVFCGHCGHAMSRNKVKTKYNFACHFRERCGLSDCVPNRISETDLTNYLLEMLQKQAAVFTDIRATSAKFAVDNTALRNVQAELGKNSLFFKGLYESLVSGDINESEYKELKTTYETRIATLTETERQLRESARLQALEAVKQSNATDSLQALRCVSDLTVEAVDRLIEKIIVFEDKHIEVRFKFTDEIMRTGAGQ